MFETQLDCVSIGNMIVSSTSVAMSEVFPRPQQTPPGAQEGEGAQEACDQKASERFHALHEGDEGEGDRRVHPERERRHQPDPGETGESRVGGGITLA